MEKLYWLDQIQLQDRAKVGDKAFHLSIIKQRGYPVMPGFVVSASVLREFLETLHNSEALVADLPHSSLRLDVNNWRQLQQVAHRLRQEIITATVPAQLSNTIFNAAKTWESCLVFRPTITIPTLKQELENISGLLESQFCYCDDEQAIAHTLKQTWSQIFRAKSLLYWQTSGIDLRQINLAVLVQPLQNAVASGLLNANSSGWEIQATYGLGVAIAQGEVLPDVYYIQSETGIVQEQQLGNKMLAYGLGHTSNQAVPPGFTSVLAADQKNIVAYLLEEAKQQQYALPQEFLQQLIQLANQFEREISKNFTLEWTISIEGNMETLYLTQVNTSSSAPPHLLIKGLGAVSGRVIANAFVVQSQQKPEQIPLNAILVTQVITPDWLPFLQKSTAIITEHGGLTSHGAILARELGIPAVVGASKATSVIQNGELLLVDGDTGEVSRIGGSRGVGDLRKNSRFPIPDANIQNQHSQVGARERAKFQNSLPIIATQLLVNLSQPSLIEQVQGFPVDGVGLLRSELMALSILEGKHPHTWLSQGRKTQLLERWSEQVMQFAIAFAPRPIFYRSLDWRSHELPSGTHSLQSSSSGMLGNRGIFSYWENPEIFELELTALLNVQQAGYSNIRLLLPFVRTVEEFSFCRQKVEQAKLTQVSQFQLWIMAEVPSILFLLPSYVKAGVQGISIGTNDLTQLLLGVDRELGQLARVYDQRHPVVMEAIAKLISMAKDAGIPCSICGQAPALYPEIIEQLVQWGITSISVESDAIFETYHAIARAEQKLILEAARRQLNQ